MNLSWKRKLINVKFVIELGGKRRLKLQKGKVIKYMKYLRMLINVEKLTSKEIYGMIRQYSLEIYVRTMF